MISYYKYLKKALELEEFKDKEEELEKFFSLMQTTAHKIKTHIKAKSLIHVVSHLDADGLSSAGLMINFLKEKNVPFIHTVLKQVNKEYLSTLLNSEADLFIFLDFGSQTKVMEEFQLLTKKDVVVIDHHPPERETFITNLNPYYCGLNGEIISSSPLTYLTLNFIEDFKDYIYLAIIGAIGDMQEYQGTLKGLNQIIFNEAIENDIVEIKKELNMYGLSFLKLEEVLFRDKRIFESFTEAINFLKKLNLEGKIYSQLNNQEKDELHKVLIDLIYLKGLEISDFFGYNYYLKKEDNPLLKDLRSYATFLNACGRLGLYSIADGVMLDVPEYKLQVNEVLKKYREELAKALKWVEENKGTEKVIEDENKIIINAENEIKDTLIGTVSSILINQYNKDMVIGISKDPKIKEYKISIRTKDEKVHELINQLNDLGEFGGHKKAGGGKVKQTKITEFINRIRRIKV